MVTRTLELGACRLGGGARCFVIAEAGVNHNGDPLLAERLIDAAADAGADAVKFQTFDPKALASATAPKAEYQHRSSTGKSQLEMLQALDLAREAYPRLQQHAARRGILFLSSPFEDASAAFLARLGVPAFKVPSGELTNTPFLRRLAAFGKPLLVSTGMATLAEVEAAVAAVGSTPLGLFHCVSSYPTSPADANLHAMATMRARFNVPVGWSDHLIDLHVATAAVALGAEVLEKHLTLDRKMDGPDHAASTEPAEFARLVRELRDIESALGSGTKAPVPAELGVAAVARKSLHWATALQPGQVVEEAHLHAMRPGTGISPARTLALVGKRLARAVQAGAAVTMTDLEGGS
jgi:N,N'-diacetyllegionaminate synthase